MRKATSVSIRVISDILCFVVLFLAMGVFQNIQPFRRGYFSQDESIRLPYHPSTIPSVVLISVTITLIVVTITASELCIFWDRLTVRRAGLPIVLYSLYDYLLAAFFGYCANITITDVCKVAIGRLRPNFFSVCEPVPTSTTALGYIASYSCKSGTPRDHRDITKSFPSGHSSLSVYTAVFLCIYLQMRQPPWRNAALRLAFQAVFLALAIVTCISRIVDNKHHPTDVIAGAALGLVVAFSVPFYVPKLFCPPVNHSCLCGLMNYHDRDPEVDTPNHLGLKSVTLEMADSACSTLDLP
ncbi:unnamed protein product [Dicrocoelium dendriticum]|nr:unnamed protein product [Dicrocoelium dendriticum]